jgi:hypothetical protein
MRLAAETGAAPVREVESHATDTGLGRHAVLGKG